VDKRTSTNLLAQGPYAIDPTYPTCVTALVTRRPPWRFCLSSRASQKMPLLQPWLLLPAKRRPEFSVRYHWHAGCSCWYVRA